MAAPLPLCHALGMVPLGSCGTFLRYLTARLNLDCQRRQRSARLAERAADAVLLIELNSQAEQVVGHVTRRSSVLASHLH